MSEQQDNPMHPPLPPRANGEGRRRNGTFGPGNQYGRAHPEAGAASKLRAILHRQVTEQIMVKVVDALIAQAVAGDLDAIKMLLDRVLGRIPDALPEDPPNPLVICMRRIADPPPTPDPKPSNGEP